MPDQLNNAQRLFTNERQFMMQRYKYYFLIIYFYFKFIFPRKEVRQKLNWNRDFQSDTIRTRIKHHSSAIWGKIMGKR